MIPGWVIGAAVACAVFMLAVQFGVLALGIVGLLLTPFLAFWAGACAASIVNTRSPKRDALIIAVFVVGLLIAFLWRVQTRLGVQGGPNL